MKERKNRVERSYCRDVSPLGPSRSTQEDKVGCKPNYANRLLLSRIRPVNVHQLENARII